MTQQAIEIDANPININPIVSDDIFSIADKNGKMLLRITNDGMFYNGAFIEDAGEARESFVKAMTTMYDWSQENNKVVG
jgi:hypothetical protein